MWVGFGTMCTHLMPHAPCRTSREVVHSTVNLPPKVHGNHNPNTGLPPRRIAYAYTYAYAYAYAYAYTYAYAYACAYP